MSKGIWYFLTEIQYRSICFHVLNILVSQVLLSGGHFWGDSFLSMHYLRLFLWKKIILTIF